MMFRDLRRGAAMLMVLAVALPGIAAAAPAAKPAIVKAAVVLQRTTSGPSSFTLSFGITFNAKGNEGMFAALGGRVASGRFAYVVPGPLTTLGHSDNKNVTAAGQQISTCNAAGVCFNQAPFDGVFGTYMTYADEGASGNLTVWYAVAEGHTVNYKFSGKGWALKRVPLTYRYADGADSQVSVHAGSANGLEAFTSPIEVIGRGNGSLAMAVAPCSSHTVGVARGVARLSLEGGTKTETIECPATTYPGVASSATKATTWRLSGFAVGETALAETRLFVLDLPTAVRRGA